MEEGNLQFKPEDTLETEINNKYAGMKPIELIGAFKEPEGDKEVPEIDLSESESVGTGAEGKWTFDTEATEDAKEEKSKIESQPEKDEGAESEVEEELERIEEAPGPEVSDTSDQQEAEEVFDAVFGTADEDIDDSKEGESSGAEKKEEEVVAEEKDPIGTILIAVVVALVIGIGGWFIYDFGFSGSTGTKIAQTSPQPTETVDPQDGNTQLKEESAQDEEAVEPEQQSTVSKEEEDTGTQSNTPQNRYGLHGEPNQSITSGYTIVVHSLRDQQKAERNRQQLQEAGFRALISQAQVQGVTYYRVGVGQFQNVSDAQQAVDEIPERYQDNNFIKRIQ
jgi:cell division septation protein DedD